jgi:hypothetical protein
MSVSFRIRVEGIPQNIQGINNIDRDLDTAQRTLLGEISTTHQKNLKYYVHVWQPGKPRKKPHMRDTIREERRGPNYVIVTVPTAYAQTENARPGTKPGHGPHNFADQAEIKTKAEFDPKIVKTVNDILSKNRISIVVL